MNTFQTKQDVNDFLKVQDMTKGIVKVCTAAVKIVEREDSSLYDKICDMIESAQSSCCRYGNQFVATLYGQGFTQISYEASRVPKAYAFVCILKQQLPEQKA